MFHWFRRFLPNQLLASTSDVSEALRAASQYADSDDIRLEYTAAADALDRAIAHAKRYGSKSERDAVTYALGRAQINVRAQMSELIETTKEIHVLMQDVHGAQTEQGAAVGELRAEFQKFGEDMSHRMGGLEQRMDASETDRKNIRDAIRDLDQRHGGQITTIDDRLKEIERLLEIAGNHHEGGVGG